LLLNHGLPPVGVQIYIYINENYTMYCDLTKFPVFVNK
jgi:hypothetical protein